MWITIGNCPCHFAETMAKAKLVSLHPLTFDEAIKATLTLILIGLA
jgi:hypothetical protein